MSKLSLGVKTRQAAGKSAARLLRREGYIPAIVYGKIDPIAIAVDAHVIQKHWKTLSENIIINLNIDGDNAECQALVKDYQKNPLTEIIEHIDFIEVRQDQTLRTKLAVVLQGSAEGVRSGGILEHLLHEIEVECLPKDLPAHLDVDVSNLDLGAALHVSDIIVPDGVKVLDDPDTTIVLISTAKDEVESTAQAEVEEAEEAEE